jgi:5-methylthioadenosine/S-adenosylhomocysteine deaminase
MSDQLAIHDTTVLVHEEDGRVSFAEHRDVLVADGLVRAVQPSGESAPDAVETIDGRGMVAMPGFINAHAHSPMVMFRRAAEDVDDERWFNEFIWPMESNLQADDIELAARLAAAEMIRAGVTTFADHYFHMDRIARVVDETGLRAVLGDTYFSSDGPAGVERGLAFAAEWDGKAGGRITAALAPHAPYTVSDDDLRATARAALDHDLLVHVHASEGRAQTRHSLSRRGLPPIGVLERTGLLDARVLIAHGIGIVPEDLAALGSARAVGVASAPKGYLKHGTDTTPVRMLRAAGIPVGLATDGAASNNTVDVWESMTYLALVQKAVEHDPSYLTARDALHHATLQSAAVVGLAGVVGSIAPGHQADIVLVDLASPRLQPVHDLASTLVYSGRSDDIDTTIVAGRVLMRARRLLTVDLAAVLEELRPRLARLTDRSHGRSIQNYDA